MVVIAIIGILAAVVVLVINPIEITRKGRDASRLTEIASLQSAISAAVQGSAGSEIAATLCKDLAYPCNGSSHTGSRSSDGTGWVKIDVSTLKSISLPTLPVDPINSSNFHFTYCANADNWELNLALESEANQAKMSGDGGNDPNLYEIGTNLLLIAPSDGSCTY